MWTFVGLPAFRCPHGAIFKFWISQTAQTGILLKSARYVCCSRSGGASRPRVASHETSYYILRQGNPAAPGKSFQSTTKYHGYRKIQRLLSTSSSEHGNNKEASQEADANGTSTESFSHFYEHQSYFNKEILRKIKKKQSEQYFIYSENNFMDVNDAKQEYLLEDSDISMIPQIKRKSPYSSSHVPDGDFITVVWTKDVKKIAMEKWKSKGNLEREKILRKYVKTDPYSQWKEDKFYVKVKSSFAKDSGQVVKIALLMNIACSVLKGGVFFLTRSPSMFAEFMHSVSDVLNQVLLVWGRYLSLKKPDESHPYGYRNHIHIWSILSGVMIFSVGGGFTFFNGIQALINPVTMSADSLVWSLSVLFGTCIFDGVSLSVAIRQLRKDSKAANMSFFQYVKEGDDPLCNVVLLEDMANVAGVLVCVAAVSASYYLGLPILDAAGSLVISGMMLAVGGYLFKSNVDKLLGQSLPYEEEITKYMEADRFINAVLDHKTLDMGDQSRFKTEVVLDARLITKHFLQTEVDMDALLVKWKSVQTTEDMEKFLEEFGSKVYDQIVAHVDRKEQDIKKKFPELRHIDIEPS